MAGIATAAIIAGGISAVGSLVSGIFGSGRAKRAARRARAEKKRLRGELKSLESSRQSVINPYENTKDLSSLAQDLSGNLSNPFANLSVATGAAEMQAEQSDIALANTLDTLRASGASAGGATALAQAALQSKKGVAAGIEGQEATNEKMRAQGEEALQSQKMQEQQRVQGVQISEGRRTQSADAQGKSFMFNAKERREDSKIDYTRQQITGTQKREQQAYDQGTRAITGAITGVASGLSSMAGAGAFGGTAPPPPPSGAMVSDRKLKENIKLIGKSPNGLKIYAFEYIDKIFGKGVYQGVMSDEIPSYAVIKNNKDYDMVDYSKIDVDFKQI